MSKAEKLLKRFLLKPKDFSFDELKVLLKVIGYEELKTGKTSGSRSTFYNRELDDMIKFHKPHPSSIMKRCYLREIEHHLREKGGYKMSDVMTYKGYLGTVRYNEEDEVFHGKIEAINDLIMFEGKSVKELKKAFHEAVDDYLETCREMGREPQKPFKGSFNVRISSDLHKEAVEKATREGVSLNQFVQKAIEEKVRVSTL